jgi:hypothetical protein
MIDLHQGFTGRELEEVAPTIGSVAVVQLDATMALARGQLRRAARGQLATYRLLAKVVSDVVVEGLKQRLSR